jgi:hypothetical protein
MTTKYQATAPDGTVFRRATASRKYSHCVVRRLEASPAGLDEAGNERWSARPERWSAAEWRSTNQLAETLAHTYRNRGLHVLVLEAVEV